MTTTPTTIGDRPITMPDEPMNLALVESFKAYVEDARPLGSFCRAVLANNLTQAACAADRQNARDLAAIAKFVYWNIPTNLCGSVEKVNAHIGAES